MTTDVQPRAVPAGNPNDMITKSWSDITASETGTAWRAGALADRTVQVVGTLSNGTVIIEGSCDGGTTYFTLRDHDGEALSLTAVGGHAIREATEYIRYRTTSMFGGDDIGVHIFGRRR